jgi:antitoxin ParD1/3/4
MIMPTRNVVLTDPQARFVEQLVESGRYQNASEVLREGLRLVQQRERTYTARLEALRDAVAVGVADIEAGRYETFDDPAALESWVMALGESN